MRPAWGYGEGMRHPHSTALRRLVSALGGLGPAARGLGPALLLLTFTTACSDPAGPGLDGGPDAGSPTDGGADAGPGDGGGADGASPDGAPPTGYTRYPADALLSPLTPGVLARLQEIYDRSAAPADDVFMKVGASGTVSTNLLYCFAGPSAPQYQLEWDGRDALQGTVDWFRAGDAAGTTPFDRPTLAAEVGRTAAWCIGGDPSPLAQEIAAVNPRFAFVNYGTNDMQMGTTHASALPGFYESLMTLLDELEAAGIVPIVTGLNPRTDTVSAGQWVPTYNAVTRGLTEARQLPWINLYEAVRGLANQGLLGDGVHGNVYSAGGAQPCVFDGAGLAWNYNVRNLLSVQTLDGVRRTLLAGEPAPDLPLPPAPGAGTAGDPIVIDGLPFTHAADTTAAPAAHVDGYPGCDSGQDESGGEILYRLELAEETPLRMLVLDRGDVDVDIHLLGPDANPATCLARHDRMIQTTLPAGTYHLALDTFVPSDGVPRAGPYLLVVLRCEDGDPDCL